MLTEDEVNKIENDLLEKYINEQNGKIIECINERCSKKFLFTAGELEKNIKDEKGNLLSHNHLKHRSVFRVNCMLCKTIWCIGCKKLNYHDGLTCEELKNRAEKKLCRFCDDECSKIRSKLFINFVCPKKECKLSKKNCCSVKLNCDHLCICYKNRNHEKQCPPCLNEKCSKNAINEND